MILLEVKDWQDALRESNRSEKDPLAQAKGYVHGLQDLVRKRGFPVLIELEGRHTSGVYPKRPLAIVRGEGARLWDAEGNEYIDCVGGQGAANLGHSHPDIVRAVAEQ